MDNFQIETAQNVNIVQHVAGVGDRILAFLIDSAIMFIYIVLIFFLLGFLDFYSDSFLLIMTVMLPVLLYHLLWEQFWNGQSPGKAVMKIRVVKLDGSKPAFSNYLIRWLLRVVDITILNGAVALVVILFNGRGQRLGDLAAATTVISEKKTVSFAQTVLVDLPDNYNPVYPQVTVFTDAEIQTIKKMFQQAKYNGNHNVILKLSNRVSKVMEVQFETTPLVFIDTVIKDYNYYTQQL
ncbi:RDD family protein [Marixanthomonas spongiae]|uniref:RDD family protein n=1 Tax=Marixanthomonas spongiae TaxID=2174845 RepID=A0A2U0I3K3_9FLAO|nr:RDD family protein [Marixanthomonas spongiae]PVW15695.1 RDD family protein [Marixanthomonas spongiae]